MILELAFISVAPGQEAAFEAAVAAARPLFARAKGCRGMALRRCVEVPTDFHLMVEWDTLDNHLVDFRESPDFQAWRALAGPFFASPPKVIHTSAVAFP